MCAKYFIPVAKVWCKVGVGFLMVDIMLAGSSINAKWYQAWCGPREVIATVIFYGYVDMQHHKGPCGQKMASQDHGIQSGPKANCHQLPAAETLCGKCKGSRVFVVDGVESDIEPPDPVMKQVPDEVLEVKEQEVTYHSSYQLQQGWSLVRQIHSWPPCPLGHWSREYKEHMVIQSDTRTMHQHRRRRSVTGLYLELLDPCPPVPYDVTNKKRKAKEKVGRHSQNNRE